MNDSAWPSTDPDREVPTEELWARVALVDVAALAAVPGLLLTAHAWPGGPGDSLVLSYAEPALLPAVTTHFVHRSVDHLLANLFAYGLVVPTTYGLSIAADRRRSFFLGFALVLLAGPPLITAFDLAAFDHGVVLGFSGVAMGLVGFLPVAFGTYAEGRLGVPRGRHLGPALFFAGLGLVALRTVGGTAARVAVAAVAFLAAAFLLRASVDALRIPRELPPGVGRREAELAGAAVVVFVAALLMGFPGGSATGAVVVNTYGHLLGYAIGFVGPYLVLRPWDEPAGGIV